MLLLLYCAISYMIHVLKRSLANAVTDAGIKVTYGSFQLHFNVPLGIILWESGVGKGREGGFPTFL